MSGTQVAAMAIVVVVVAVVVGVYNSLVVLSQRYKNAYAQIDVQLRRRHDLVPNLVETAKGYMRHERETLEAVVAAREGCVSAAGAAQAAPGSPMAMQALSRAEDGLDGACRRLMLLVERYPALKASGNMLGLQEELASTENKVAFARQAFNDAVTAYNTRRSVFPANVVAALFGFRPAGLFVVGEAAAREAPAVRF